VRRHWLLIAVLLLVAGVSGYRGRIAWASVALLVAVAVLDRAAPLLSRMGRKTDTTALANEVAALKTLVTIIDNRTRR
jgi:hypothetical protein